MKRLGSDASVYSEDEVRKHVSTILRAVEYMHQQHCVHRDLKPENVLLSDNRYDTRAAAARQHTQYGSGTIAVAARQEQQQHARSNAQRSSSSSSSTHPSSSHHLAFSLSLSQLNSDDATIKIIDLGLARPFEEQKLMRTVCGTHKYLAPELVRCDRGQLQGYDSQIDMWGVGLLTYARSKARANARGYPRPALTLTLRFSLSLSLSLSQVHYAVWEQPVRAADAEGDAQCDHEDRILLPCRL